MKRPTLTVLAAAGSAALLLSLGACSGSDSGSSSEAPSSAPASESAAPAPESSAAEAPTGDLTPANVEAKLTEAGIECGEVGTEDSTEEDGIKVTAVSCTIGQDGGIVVAIAPSVDEMVKAKADFCGSFEEAEGDTLGDEATELAYGSTWLALTLTTEVTAAQVADALGGTATTTGEYCKG